MIKIVKKIELINIGKYKTKGSTKRFNQVNNNKSGELYYNISTN